MGLGDASQLDDHQVPYSGAGGAASSVATTHPSWARSLYLGAWAALAVACLYVAVSAVYGSIESESGVSFAFARSLSNGLGPALGPGAPWVEGYSGPVWVLLLALLGWLGVAIPNAALALSLFCYAAVVGLLVVISWGGQGRQGEGSACRWVRAAFAVALLAISVDFSQGMLSGREYALMAPELLGLVALESSELRHPHRVGWSGLAAFLLAITRPEGLLCAVGLLLLKVCHAVLNRRFVYQATTAGLLLLIPLLSYYAVHYSVFKSLLPNAQPTRLPISGISDAVGALWSALELSGLLYVLPLILLGAVWGRRYRLMAAVLIACAAGYIGYLGGATLAPRTLSYFLPVAVLLVVAGLDFISVAISRLSGGRLSPHVSRLMVALPLLLQWWRYHAPRIEGYAQSSMCQWCDEVEEGHRLKRLARRARLGAASVASRTIGGIAWLGDERFQALDLSGRADRTMALLSPQDRAHPLEGASRQYLMQELPWPPTLLQLQASPPRWAKGEEAYVPLRLGLADPPEHAWAIHRSSWVDFFPDIPAWDFRELSDDFVLLGHSSALEPLGGGSASSSSAKRLRVTVVLLARHSGAAEGARFRVRLEGEGQPLDSEALDLDRRLHSIATAIAPGEPMDLHFELPVASSELKGARLLLGVARQEARNDKAGQWQFHPLEAVRSGEAAAPSLRTLPRYPRALPAATSVPLAALQIRVAALTGQRRALADFRVVDPVLAAQLLELSRSLRGQPTQSYLAMVLATQADPAVGPRIAEEIAELRPLLADDSSPLELSLLHQFYATGRLDHLSHLVGFYASQGRWEQAHYFSSRRAVLEGESGLWTALDVAVWQGLQQPWHREELSRVAFDPHGGAFDFERAGLVGWSGDREQFARFEVSDGGPQGAHGRTFLASTSRAGVDATTDLSSAAFRLRGEVISLMLAGAPQTAAELWVEGELLFRAAPSSESRFSPVLWNVGMHRERWAVVRLVDSSPTGRIAMDHLLLWR